MKKFLLLFLLFFLSCVHAACMGRFDKVSGNWHVKNNYFSCTFLQGNMFPGEFIFKDGTQPGSILFRDTVTGPDGKVYALFEERWAETAVLKNDEKSFVIERRGRFYRNASPLISPLEGVKVCCRYEFQKDSPEVVIQITYQKEKDISCKIDSSIHAAWYFNNPFDRITCGKKQENFEFAANKKFRHWNSAGSITLTGKKAVVCMKSSRVIATLAARTLYACSLNGGFWQYQWKKGKNLKAKAVLRLTELK